MYVQTPLIPSRKFDRPVLLKLENAQPTGSFKARGMTTAVDAALATNKNVNFYCASAGNAGIAAADAADCAGRPCTVVVPEPTSPAMVEKLKRFGAEVLLHGSILSEADQYLKTLMADDPNAFYLHPYDLQTLWEGHSSLVDELVEQLHGVKPAAIALSVGGAGLYIGVMIGLERHGWLDVPVIAIETENANCFYQSVKAGEVVVTGPPTSIARCLACSWVPQAALDYARKSSTHNVLVSDQEAVEAVKRYANDHGSIVEPGCGATLASLYFGKIPRYDDRPVVAIVCGGSSWGWEDLNTN